MHPSLHRFALRSNATKLAGLRRWFRYAGLGWHDTRDVFQCDPYDRVRRRLGKVFGKETQLLAPSFFANLSRACPELDGGTIFLTANPDYQRHGDRYCTLGLSHALIGLHLDGVIRLHCPGDSDGWHIGHAAPPMGGTIASERIDRVERLAEGDA